MSNYLKEIRKADPTAFMVGDIYIVRGVPMRLPVQESQAEATIAQMFTTEAPDPLEGTDAAMLRSQLNVDVPYERTYRGGNVYWNGVRVGFLNPGWDSYVDVVGILDPARPSRPFSQWDKLRNELANADVGGSKLENSRSETRARDQRIKALERTVSELTAKTAVQAAELDKLREKTAQLVTESNELLEDKAALEDAIEAAGFDTFLDDHEELKLSFSGDDVDAPVSDAEYDIHIYGHTYRCRRMAASWETVETEETGETGANGEGAKLDTIRRRLLERLVIGDKPDFVDAIRVVFGKGAEGLAAVKQVLR